MKVAFLDRDGTVIADYPDKQWANVTEPAFFDDSIETLQLISQLGYAIIFVSNQYLINDGIITLEQFEKVNQQFLNTLSAHNIPVLDFYFCPHNDNDGCMCKKPKTGMIDAALQKYPDIDIGQSFYVGDSIVDVELAKNVGLKMFHISSENKKSNDHYIPVQKLKDVYEYL